MGLGKHRPLKPNKKRKVRERANSICEHENCDEKIDDSNSEIHHIVAIEFGGSDNIDNLALICLNCHKLISQYCQRSEVKIQQYEKLLWKDPLMPFWRRRKLEQTIKSHKEALEKEFKFKNREI